MERYPACWVQRGHPPPPTADIGLSDGQPAGPATDQPANPLPVPQIARPADFGLVRELTYRARPHAATPPEDMDRSDREEGLLDPQLYIHDYLALVIETGNQQRINKARQNCETLMRRHRQRVLRRRTEDRADDTRRGYTPSVEELQHRNEWYERGLFRRGLPLDTPAQPVPPQDERWGGEDLPDDGSWGAWSQGHDVDPRYEQGQQGRFLPLEEREHRQ